jgi:hypothetical protein
LLFVACLFTGMAVGFYMENIKIGILGGLGLSFALMAITILSAANKNR